jgi:hypothetical protein
VDDLKFRRAAVLAQFLLNGLFLADENDFNAEFLRGEQGAFNHAGGSMVSPHRINGNSRHMGGLCSALLGLDHGAAAIKSTMRAGPVRQNGFAAVRANAPLRFAQSIMGAALVFHPL